MVGSSAGVANLIVVGGAMSVAAHSRAAVVVAADKSLVAILTDYCFAEDKSKGIVVDGLTAVLVHTMVAVAIRACCMLLVVGKLADCDSEVEAY